MKIVEMKKIVKIKPMKVKIFELYQKMNVIVKIEN
jgi:hypothetical protein